MRFDHAVRHPILVSAMKSGHQPDYSNTRRGTSACASVGTVDNYVTNYMVEF